MQHISLSIYITIYYYAYCYYFSAETSSAHIEKKIKTIKRSLLIFNFFLLERNNAKFHSKKKKKTTKKNPDFHQIEPKSGLVIGQFLYFVYINWRFIG